MKASSRTRHEGLCAAVAAGFARERAVFLRARGASMRPAIQDGEEVRLRPLGAHALGVGDVVLAQTPGGASLHRVIAADPSTGQVLLKGDGLRGPDAHLPFHAVLARADAVRRGGRWVRIDTRWRKHLGLFLSLCLAPRAPLRALARRLVRAGSL
ncbi:MAG: S24/S26 family peptidase [Myxococcota bacterium]